MTALVAVVAAVIWAVVPGDGSLGKPDVTPAPVAISTASDEGSDSTGRRVYVWDPNSGDVRAVFSAPRSLASSELSPDGERIVYDRIVYDLEEMDGRSQIYVREADGTERRLTYLESGAYDPTWSPDGSQIAFAAGPGVKQTADIFVMNADGRHVRRLVGTPAEDGDPDWSPDGSRISFHALYPGYPTPREGILLASVRTGTLRRLTPLNDIIAMDPAWSPDGRWIAYSSTSRGGTVVNGRIYSAGLWRMRPNGTSKSRITRPDPDRVYESPSWSPDGHLIVFQRRDWAGLHDRVVVVNTRTERMRTFLTGLDLCVHPGLGVSPWASCAESSAPSWSEEGILVSLPNTHPVPRPGAAPLAFRVPGAAPLAFRVETTTHA